MRKISILLALVAGLFATQANADWTGKDAAGATTTFKNPGVCTSVVCVPVYQIYDGTNVVTLTTAGADGVSNTLTGVPMYGRNLLYNGTTWDRWLGDTTNGAFVNVKASVLPTGAATSALQSSAAAAKGEGATGAAVPSGAQYVGLNSGGNLLGWAAKAGNTYAATDVVPGVAVVNTQVAVANNADGVSATSPAGSPVVNYNYLWNGTTWDRQKPSTAVVNPCESVAQTSLPISITTATTTQIVAASASNKTYICSLFLTSAAADNVGIVEGTGGTCGTGTAGVIGGATAANGPNFAANGGVFLQAGGKVAVAQTAGTNVGLCLITSAATPLAGVLKYVQAP